MSDSIMRPPTTATRNMPWRTTDAVTQQDRVRELWGWGPNPTEPTWAALKSDPTVLIVMEKPGLNNWAILHAGKVLAGETGLTRDQAAYRGMFVAHKVPTVPSATVTRRGMNLPHTPCV